jgi:small conductance mechanosensitive channel
MIPLFIAEIANLDTYIQRFLNNVVDFIPSLIKAVILLVVGIIAIKIFRKVITRLMTTRDVDPTFLKFILDACTWIFRVVLLLMIVEQLGVKTTSLMALLGTIGIAVGLSLQGSLSNFAGGLLIILFKPFRVGDYIEAQGQGGTVQSIQIFSTQLLTGTNQVVYLPNGTLSNNTIKNFSQEPIRRADILLSVSYTSDLKQVKEAIRLVIDSDQKILKTPSPGIEVSNLAENAVILKVLIWSERSNYSAMISDFYENIKSVFEKTGIDIPFPQRDLNIKGGEKTNDAPQ